MDSNYIVLNQQESIKLDMIKLGLNILFSYVDVIARLQSKNYNVDYWQGALAKKNHKTNKCLKHIAIHRAKCSDLKMIYSHFRRLHINQGLLKAKNCGDMEKNLITCLNNQKATTRNIFKKTEFYFHICEILNSKNIRLTYMGYISYYSLYVIQNIIKDWIKEDYVPQQQAYYRLIFLDKNLSEQLAESLAYLCGLSIKEKTLKRLTSFYNNNHIKIERLIIERLSNKDKNEEVEIILSTILDIFQKKKLL